MNRYLVGALLLLCATMTVGAQAPVARPSSGPVTAPIKPEDQVKALQTQLREMQRQLAQATYDEGIAKAQLGQCLAREVGPPEAPAPAVKP